jgi:hypothetical protein
VKPRILGLLAGAASLGFGWWLLDQPHTSRELFLCMVAWVLGFWVATGLRGTPPLEGESEGDDEDDLAEEDEG